MSLPDCFPALDASSINNFYNPAFFLFGQRFFKDQTTLEYLTEFLGIALGEKKLGSDDPFTTTFPELDVIASWTKQDLKYKLPLHLTTKLFALFGRSRIDGRDKVHEEQFKMIVERLSDSIESYSYTPEQIVNMLEEFLSGFQGTGINRGWSAQTFYPVCSGLLNQETIWNKSKAKREPPEDWDTVLDNFNDYFRTNERVFMARGGEVLYLQLCNVFNRSREDIEQIGRNLALSDQERDIIWIFNLLQDGLPKIYAEVTRGLDTLLQFIENLDSVSKNAILRNSTFTKAGWCPRESWREGYLFAVELTRLLMADIDPVERLELMTTGCSMQVLRSLSAQSSRYVQTTEAASALDYSWIFSEPDARPAFKQIAQRNLQVNQRNIFQALRIPALKEQAARDRRGKTDYYKQADERYGHQLFLSLGKRLGIIVPYTGPGARIVMTDRLLSYLVAVLIPPGQMCTYEDFLNRMYTHYGIAIEGKELKDALAWSGLPANDAICSSRGTWLVEMLRAGGYLTELSDAWSIVHNPYNREIV